MKKILIISFIFSLFFAGSVKAVEPVVKIRDSSYSAQFVSQSEKDPIIVETGAVKVVTIKFKNVGLATWDSSKSSYVSAYTMEPRGRISVFKGADWLNGEQTAKVVGKIKPGQIGELKLDLRAPSKIGEYLEKFYLASENNSWVKGGYFFLKIKVVKANTQPTNNTGDSSTKASGCQANLFIQNIKQVTASGGDLIKLVIGFQNVGKNIWNSYKIKVGDSLAVTGTSIKVSFADASWKSSSLVMENKEEVAPEGFLRTEFYFRAPAKTGIYTASFNYEIDNQEVPGMGIAIPVTVTADAAAGYQAPSFSDNQNEGEIKMSMSLGTEPRLRVGINAPEGNFLQFRSYEDDYGVYTGGELKGILPIKKFAVIKFEDGAYSFQGGDLVFSTDKFVRLQPVNNPHAVFTVPNLIRTAKWVNPSASFNSYRGAVEYRQGEVDKKMYIINDLFLEDYVKGMAENSLLAPMEFLKANLTAARNYAYVSIGKYPFFDVIANTYDQLYLGKEAEETLPNVVASAEATRGVFVTYNNEIVTTPYFGNSNGWTKSWSSVWGGANKPWLVSVKANYDTGKKQNGHGVGMSQLDAFNRVKNENVDFVDLLKYYYTGTEVEKMY